MGVKKTTKKGQKKMRKQRYLSANVDGEESVDDDKSPRKGRRAPSKLVSEQLLSPLSQSTTETTYSSILESDLLAQENVNACESVLNFNELASRSFDEINDIEIKGETEEDRDKAAEGEVVVQAGREADAEEEARAQSQVLAEENAEVSLQDSDEGKEDSSVPVDVGIPANQDIHAMTDFTPETDMMKTIETREISGESEDVKISPEHSMSTTSSFVTAKTTYKSPAFKKMKKAAGRAFSFVARKKGKMAKN